MFLEYSKKSKAYKLVEADTRKLYISEVVKLDGSADWGVLVEPCRGDSHIRNDITEFVPYLDEN